MREEPITCATCAAAMSGEAHHVACEACGRQYREGSGVSVSWDVMGDPRASVEVCLACAFVALSDDEAAL